jgi:hypothetical protein
VTVAKKRHELKLGKGWVFYKGRVKRLQQEDETWEADFRALPKTMTQAVTHYLGLVVTKRGDLVLADTRVEGRPSVNDLAALLAMAIRQPLTGQAHLPRRLHVRGRRLWQGLFPHLEDLGIKVSVTQQLSTFRTAYLERLRQRQEARRAKMVKPTEEQVQVEDLFPAIAQWVRDGHIEIGDQEGFGFVAMALDYGGLVFEDDRPRTLAEAMAALEEELRKWFDEQGIDLG